MGSGLIADVDQLWPLIWLSVTKVLFRVSRGNSSYMLHETESLQCNGSHQGSHRWWSLFILNFQEILQKNYRKVEIKQKWLDGEFSNLTKFEDLPKTHMWSMNAEDWGEILERELARWFSGNDGAFRCTGHQNLCILKSLRCNDHMFNRYLEYWSWMVVLYHQKYCTPCTSACF